MINDKYGDRTNFFIILPLSAAVCVSLGLNSSPNFSPSSDLP
jgi:hypothetical protein